MQTFGKLVAVAAIAAWVGTAQANDRMHGQRSHVHPKPPQAVGNAHPPLNPMGHNLGQTFIQPAVPPVQFKPNFPAAPPHTTIITPPSAFHQPGSIHFNQPGPSHFNTPPPVIHHPGSVTVGPQVPAISPSAPLHFSPPVQTIDPVTGQTVIIQR